MAGEPAFAVSTMQVVVHERVKIPGPEDIVIDHAAGIAFVASQRRRSAAEKIVSNPDKMESGAIFALDLSGTLLDKRLLADQASLGFPFHPRGCSFFAGKDGVRRLLVISDRARGDHVVEVFDVTGETFATVSLQYVRTVADTEHLITPNDLVALDGDRFYVTNDHGARSLLLRSLEDLCGLPWSTVVFWDGHRCHMVARGIAFANGIALDRERNRDCSVRPLHPRATSCPYISPDPRYIRGQNQ